MRAAVAIHAGGCIRISALNRFRVVAAIVGGLLIGVACSAAYFLRSRLVRCAGHVGVTVHTREHAAVDRVLELLRIDLQADRLAVDFVSESGVAVAGQAFICGGFGRLFLGSRGEG